jgi:hypothetical protein
MSINYWLLGTNGVRYDMSDGLGPIRLISDPEGIHGPPRQPVYQEEAGYGGSWWRGQIDQVNKITAEYRFGPVESGDAGVAEAIRWERALGKGRSLAEFHVEDTDAGTHRWQYVRNNDQNPPVPLKDARAIGYYNRARFTLYSDKSYWDAAPIVVVLESGDLTGHSIRNLGDFSAAPFYVIDGPTVGLKIGLGGEKVTLANIGAGKQYRIDTNPSLPLVHDETNTDVWATKVGLQSWNKRATERNDAGITVDTPITVEGTAQRIEITLPQQYWAGVG